jgi:glutathione peroxidase
MNSSYVHGKDRLWRRVGALFLAAGSACLSLAAQAQVVKAPAPAATGVACPALLQHRFDRLQDEKPQSLCQYAGRVVLVVNTASYCGFTGQYQGLEARYARYPRRGLVGLGFPAHDFGRQEPGNNRAIADFCENTFGVKFPMFSKTSVTGREANPLYRQLAEKTGDHPRWNFHKYLIGRDGQTVRSYPSTLDPKNPSFVKDIERFLSTKS